MPPLIRRTAAAVAFAGGVLLAGGACATGSNDRPAWSLEEMDGPLRVHVESATLLSRSHPHVRYAVSDRAHVTVFQIDPFGFARALHPTHPKRSGLTEAGRHRVFSYGGPAHNIIGWYSGYGTGLGSWRMGRGWGDPGQLSYLLVVASRHPLPLDQIAPLVPFRFGGNSLPGLQIGPSSAFGTMEEIVDRLVEPYWPDRDWAVDWSYVLWTDPPSPSLSRLRITARFPRDGASETETTELTGQELPDVLRPRPDSTDDREWTRYRPELPTRGWIPAEPELPPLPPRTPKTDTVVVIRMDAPPGERVRQLPVRRRHRDDPLDAFGRLWLDRHPPARRSVRTRDREPFRFDRGERREYGSYFRRWVDEPFARDRLDGADIGDGMGRRPRVTGPRDRGENIEDLTDGIDGGGDHGIDAPDIDVPDIDRGDIRSSDDERDGSGTGSGGSGGSGG